MRDFQKSKVYHWESVNGIWGSKRLSNNQADNLIEKVERYCHCKATPKITFRKRTTSRGSSTVIKLNNSPTIWLVIHEATHHIAYAASEGDSHGPKFVRLLIELLHHYKVADRNQLLRSAKVNGIEVAKANIIRRIKLEKEGR